MDEIVEVGGVAHRVICGDFRDISVPAGGATLVWDPPWDMDITPPRSEWAHVLGFADAATVHRLYAVPGWPPARWQFVWDCASSWYTPNRPLKRHKIAAWFGKFPFDPDGFFVPRANPTRIVRNSRGEHVAGDPRGTRMSDLYQRQIASFHSASGEHRHGKPAEWLAYMIAGVRAASVFDPCAGGGAAAVAAATIGVPSVSVEIQPEFAAAIVSRLHRLRVAPNPQAELFR